MTHQTKEAPVDGGGLSAESLKARAQVDGPTYARHLASGDDRSAYRIEENWSLEGWPPEVVSTTLHGVAQGLSFDDALEAALGPVQDHD